MFSRVEHEKSFITSGPFLVTYRSLCFNGGNWPTSQCQSSPDLTPIYQLKDHVSEVLVQYEWPGCEDS